MAVNTQIKIGDLLKGCRPARVQSVGVMQIIPLISDLQDERFVSPGRSHISTKTYGHMVFHNVEDKTMIIPAGATYILDQAAQNHALPHAGFAKAKADAEFKTAMCVQQGQGGTIKPGEYPLMLLPMPLREKAHLSRNGTEFQRLWPAIAAFNRDSGLPEYGTRGHLEHFFEKFKKDLDSFVAQFEPVEQQVGAIILVNGRIVGVERCPSTTYFRSIWRPLIRECYGSLAVIEASKEAKPPVTRVPLRRVTSLEDLEAAVLETEEAERQKVAALVRNVLDLSVNSTVDAAGELTRVSIGNESTGDKSKGDATGDATFVGSVLRDGVAVVYASLVAADKWRQRADWMTAEAFSM